MRSRKNLRNHRDRLSIMAEILKIEKGGSLKTRIMFKANLNSAQLDEYLTLLLETGLLETVSRGDEILYKTTRKGIHFIQDFNGITALLKRGFIPGKKKEPQIKSPTLITPTRTIKKADV